MNCFLVSKDRFVSQGFYGIICYSKYDVYRLLEVLEYFYLRDYVPGVIGQTLIAKYKPTGKLRVIASFSSGFNIIYSKNISNECFKLPMIAHDLFVHECIKKNVLHTGKREIFTFIYNKNFIYGFFMKKQPSSVGGERDWHKLLSHLDAYFREISVIVGNALGAILPEEVEILIDKFAYSTRERIFEKIDIIDSLYRKDKNCRKLYFEYY